MVSWKELELRNQRMWILSLTLGLWVWHFTPYVLICKMSDLSVLICNMANDNTTNFSGIPSRWESMCCCCCSSHHTIPKSVKEYNSWLGDFQFQFILSKIDCLELSAQSGHWVISETPCYLTYPISLWSLLYSRCQLCPLSSSFLPTTAGPVKPGPVPGPRWHRSVAGLWVHRTQAQPVTILAKLQQVNPLQKIIPTGRQIILK